MQDSNHDYSIGPILHLLDSFNIGGTESQAVRLIYELQEEGYAIHVSCLNREGPLIRFLAGQDILEYRLKRFFHRDTLVKLIRFRNDLRKKGIKILHCHDFYTNVFGTVAGRLAGVPIIINSRRDMGDLIRPSQQKLHRMISKMATHIVANAHVIQQRLIDLEHIPSRRISVVYNGIDLPNSTQEDRMKQRGDSFHVGMIANFYHPWKGHFYFIKAAALVVERIPGVKFFLAGDGPLRRDSEKLAKEIGIGDRVTFKGRIDPAEILSHLNLYVCASLSEGLSNSILEAMAYGIPVVATHVGGNVELLKTRESGLLAEPANEKSLAKAILWMWENPSDRYRMGERGKNFIEESFSWSSTCKKYQTLYKMLSERMNGNTSGPH
jgi:glycosyltransferase involved in cell wall biosynthesis